MSLFVSTFLKLVLLAFTFSRFCPEAVNCQKVSSRNLVKVSCPLNFNAFYKLVGEGPRQPTFKDVRILCRYIPEGIRFLRSEYLRTTGYFIPPDDTLQDCLESYHNIVHEYFHGFNFQDSCGYHPEWISRTCLNITFRTQFESRFPMSELEEIRLYCNQTLKKGLSCQSCTNTLLSLVKLYFNGTEAGNVSECSGYLFMYAAAFVNQFGPTDPTTAKCLFKLEYPMRLITSRRHRPIVSYLYFCFIISVLGASIAVWFFWRLHKKYERGNDNFVKDETNLDLGLGLHQRSDSLAKFKIEEIRKATMNFSRDNIIGKGGYGNVYKGKLLDGSEVAFKRFKNCSASGVANFAHEVEIIASVRHVNLVVLRGYCTATVPMEGHQRIIVCDLMRNGSLYDHLFVSGKKKLSWPIRKKIALGTTRGLAYLHNGVHPAIIHRDIKASNILLDESFEAKVADFGLAKFNSQGKTHLSTRVAGTLGYVAPEYALYGKLTERSDVYSFGVVLLELLSGRKAYQNNDGEVFLLTDWAWSLVREGRASEVVEEDMPEMVSPVLMEHYVLVAVICAHPLLQARPTMDQIVKTLETYFPVQYHRSTSEKF